MVIIFLIWQIIILSSKFSLNWAISSVFIYYFFPLTGVGGQTLSGKTIFVVVVVETLP